jgi:hypothetical protein
MYFKQGKYSGDKLELENGDRSMDRYHEEFVKIESEIAINEVIKKLFSDG